MIFRLIAFWNWALKIPPGKRKFEGFWAALVTLDVSERWMQTALEGDSLSVKPANAGSE
jgi:hypothetical protein